METAWNNYTKAEKKKVFDFAEEDKAFISSNKTERECTKAAEKIAKKHGYVELNAFIKKNKKLSAGDKIYVTNRGKNFAAFLIGKKPLSDGIKLLGAHIDSPRLDLKQHPIYEDTGMAFAKTHYYGGIKKYQWVTLPMAIHGVVCKKDGTTVDVVIGEKADDPVVGVTDLLIHLAREQMQKKSSEVVEGEQLNITLGTIPLTGKAKEKEELVKKNILAILKENYDFEEEDFISAEFEIVPAGFARDYGIDRSMIIGYGHDDRVCAYTSLMALMDMKSCDRTSVCLLVDKEEIGSVGATGMQSRFFDDTLVQLMSLEGKYDELNMRKMYRNSDMLSSDVSAAYDPNFPQVMEKNNSAYFGKGIVLNKYVGSGGKGGTNDANPEYIARIRKAFDLEKSVYQTAELGRVDAGGGGTIAYILANYNMNVVDCGVPVLSMHSPWEVVSKADVYETYKAYQAFIKNI